MKTVPHKNRATCPNPPNLKLCKNCSTWSQKSLAIHISRIRLLPVQLFVREVLLLFFLVFKKYSIQPYHLTFLELITPPCSGWMMLAISCTFSVTASFSDGEKCLSSNSEKIFFCSQEANRMPTNLNMNITLKCQLNRRS